MTNLEIFVIVTGTQEHDRPSEIILNYFMLLNLPQTGHWMEVLRAKNVAYLPVCEYKVL